MSDLLEAAIDYANAGLRVFPCWGITNGKCDCGDRNCKSPGKHPHGALAPEGVKSATDDEDIIRLWWTHSPNANVAIATGQGVFGVDLDAKHNGEASFLTLASAHEELPETASVDTGGGGSHFYFAVDDDISVPNQVHMRVGPDRLKGVDIRGDHGYLIAPPSRHQSGRRYAWGNGWDHIRAAPSWLMALVAGDHQGDEVSPHTHNRARDLEADELEDINGALAAIPATCSYETWVRVGMALYDHSGGSDEAYALWDGWSSTAAEEYPGPQETRKKWRSFSGTNKRNPIGIATLFMVARDHGYRRNKKPATPQPAKLDPEEMAPVADTPTPFPKHVIDQLQGPIKDLHGWMLDCSRRPDPIISLGAALAATAALWGRRVVGPDDTRPNLTVAVLAPSGSGKDKVQECIKNLLNMNKEMGVGIMDDTPTHRAQLDDALLKNRGQLLLVLDEYGGVLQRWMTKADAASSSMSPAIRRLSTHGNTIYHLYPLSARHKSREENKRAWDAGIFAPALSMVGFATEEQFYGSLTEDSLTDGFLGRHIVLETKNLERLRPPKRSSSRIPPFLADWLAAIRTAPTPRTAAPGDFAEVPLDQSQLPEYPMQVGYADGAKGLWVALCDELDTGSIKALEGDDETRSAILRRLPGQIANLAFVLALGEALIPEQAAIGCRHIEIAREVCEWSARQLTWRLRHGVARDQVGQALRKVLDIVERAGSDRKVYKSRLAERVGLAPYLDRVWPILQQMPRFVTNERWVRLRGADEFSTEPLK